MTCDSCNRGMIIWPIAQKLFQSVMYQQRPRFTGGLRIAKIPVLPWDDMDRPPTINFGSVDRAPIAASTLPVNFALCATNIRPVTPNNVRLAYFNVNSMIRIPGLIHSLKPMQASVFKLTGVSKDSSGSVLANCTMSLFRVDYDSGNNIVYTFLGQTVSDASGNYYFFVNTNSNYRVTGDKAGGTPVAGITLNNLTGILS